MVSDIPAGDENVANLFEQSGKNVYLFFSQLGADWLYM
jgi:hypothetical protein